MRFRPYAFSDREAVLDIFWSNTPTAFRPSEEEDPVRVAYAVPYTDRLAALAGAGGA